MIQRNLKYAVDMYCNNLSEQGQKPTTVNTAKRILSLLSSTLGNDLPIHEIRTVEISEFFSSDHVRMKSAKRGKLVPRASNSIEQIRRIIRMALVWWWENGWISELPLPPEDLRFILNLESVQTSFKKGTNSDQSPDPVNDVSDKAPVFAHQPGNPQLSFGF